MTIGWLLCLRSDTSQEQVRDRARALTVVVVSNGVERLGTGAINVRGLLGLWAPSLLPNCDGALVVHANGRGYRSPRPAPDHPTAFDCEFRATPR